MSIIFANVEGLPIPFDSSSLTKDASVNLGGGLVSCFSKLILLIFSFSPSIKFGKLFSSLVLDSSKLSMYAAIYPLKIITCPVDLKYRLSFLITALVWFKIAGFI